MDNLKSKPIVTALASFGMSGEVFHAPVITSIPHFYLKTVFERSSEKAIQIYPWVKVVKTFDDILKDTEIELVIVNTPNLFHYSLTKQALLAGKHVVVEKPFTVSIAEGEELIQLAKDKQLVLSVFHSKRYESDFLTLQSVIQENMVGKPVEMHWHYDRYRTHITHKKWKEDAVDGAGVLYDLGVHLIDSATQLFGQPKTINAHLRTLRIGAGAPDYFHIRLGYADTDVYLHASTMVREKGPHIALHGTLGSFVKYSNDPQEEQSKAGIRPGDLNWGMESEAQWGILNSEIAGQAIRKPFESKKGGYENYYIAIADSIRNNVSVPVPAEQALQNIRIIHCALQSHQEQRTLTL
jgi:scyllo-inositol 2-dehydrogenase (NADP+)